MKIKIFIGFEVTASVRSMWHITKNKLTTFKKNVFELDNMPTYLVYNAYMFPIISISKPLKHTYKTSVHRYKTFLFNYFDEFE